MVDLPLNALRAFAAVYETGGVRPAARSLQVTHSAVSRHLRELEAWIGLPLVQPRDGNRSLRFTPQGEALGRTALTSLRDLESAITAVREAKRGNTVTISTTPSFASRWLLPRLPGLADLHPWIELSVIVDQRHGDPSEQGADLGIRMGKGPWPDLTCEPLMDDILYPVMSPAFWEEAGRPNGLEDLAGLRLLHDRDPHTPWEVWRKTHGPNTLSVRSGPRFTSSDLVIRAAAQGMGVALARDRLARDDVAAGVLLRPLGDMHVELKDAYWIVLSKDAHSRMATHKVIGWLKGETAKPSAASPRPIG